MIRYKNTIARTLALNLGVTLLVLAGFEGYLFYAQAGTWSEARNLGGQIIKRNEPDNVLGWVPVKEKVVHWKRYYKDELLFDVTYEIDEHGLRVSNAEPSTNSSECVLFFGGSFTFGAGVNDSETMPYIVSSISSTRLRTYNFGYSAYGAHQMLSALEHGIVKDIIDCTPKYAIYQGLISHLRRAVNKTTWTDNNGPKYVLDENGEPVYSGQFDVPTTLTWGRSQLRKSQIIRALINPRVTHRDIELLVAVTDASRNWIERRYPGSQFHMLFWDERQDLNSAEIVAQLRKKEITLHLVSEILPDFHDDELKYVISIHDRHPNQSAHMRIAEYVSNKIIGSK